MAVDPWKALFRPLAFAAGDNFSRLDAIADLGATLRRAAAGLTSVAQGDLAAEIGRYAEELLGFETGDRTTRVRLVARGLRLCAEATSAKSVRPTGRRRVAERTESPERGGRSPGRCDRSRGRCQPIGKAPDRKAPEGQEEGRGVNEEGRGGDDAAPLGLGLEAAVDVLKGVGPAVAAHLSGRGLLTIEDLLTFLPLDYLDRRDLRPLSSIGPDLDGQQVTTQGTVASVTRGRPRGRARLLELGLAEETGVPPRLWCVWFRAHRSMGDRFGKGVPVWVSGTLRRYKERLQLVHPDIREVREGESAGGLRCRYPEVPGVAPRTLEQLCKQAVERFAAEVVDGVPSWVAAELGLVSQRDAIRELHLCAPGPEPDAAQVARLRRGEHEAHRRLVFDELFSLELAVALRRASWERHRAWPCPVTAEQAAALRGCFPFRLTTAQERVVSEILSSMGRDRPMHRLLQGDVGSGKTAVAFAAAHAAMTCGLQAAVMAPTEILARQHFQVMQPWCRQLGWHASLLTGETPRAVRTSLLALADAGKVNLLVGTHALLARELSLPNLGLAVVDEQHRFGVIQRARLRDRSEEQPLPHLLVMTATPIPRTMALSLYGDLDLSILDEKPPGRRAPTTRLFLGAERDEAYAFLEEQLAAGQQAFVVCPLVEESENSPAADAVGTAERLRARFSDRRVGLVHGRLAPLERDRTMAAFRAREIELLVATTVIEVGIDVPGANVMVVEHAERFGLAQLHQLRGRVGRGLAEGHCLLLSDVAPDTPAGQRLAALVRTDDGFEIAEADLALRGPGELFGTRQAGIPRLRFADLRRHLRLLSEAREAAARVVARDPGLCAPEHQAAAEVMRRRWERLPLVGAEAG